MAQFLDPTMFVPHRHSNGELQYLYHVYDNLSQTPYEDGVGINSGDPNSYLMHPQHIITYKAMAKHLDWNNRDPTYFISLYDNMAAAFQEAERRRNQVFVPGQAHRRNPASVRIAEVSMRELDRHNVFYFSRGELIQMLQVPVNNKVFSTSGRNEWFAMEYIPDRAVTRLF